MSLYLSGIICSVGFPLAHEDGIWRNMWAYRNTSITLPITTACFKAAHIALPAGMWPYHHVRHKKIREPHPVAFLSSLKTQQPMTCFLFRHWGVHFKNGCQATVFRDNTAIHFVNLSFWACDESQEKWHVVLYSMGAKTFANDQKSSSVLPGSCRLSREKQIIVGRFLMVSPACFHVGLK